MTMDQERMKELLIETFNTVSEGYDNETMRFFPASSRHLAKIVGLRGDEEVLDVACGTGNASLAVAPMLSHGRVTAVDFSSGMLAQARRKAAEAKLANIEFREGDMQSLDFRDRFDVAVCSFGIFFVSDMETQLAHIASTVKPGGRVAITSFAEGYFSPYKELLFERAARYGVPNPPQGWKRISQEEGCRQLFASAGLNNVRVEEKNMGYYLESAGDWWNIVWNAGLRRFVTQIVPEDRERFKAEHLEEVGAYRTKNGIRLDVGVLFTVGTRPK
jgi:ubiquinone/menaquinone biosynthesis C-methylase UbiE